MLFDGVNREPADQKKWPTKPEYLKGEPANNAAQMAITNAAIEIASLTKPRTYPITMDTIMAIAMIMSMIGIEDVV